MVLLYFINMLFKVIENLNFKKATKLYTCLFKIIIRRIFKKVYFAKKTLSFLIFFYYLKILNQNDDIKKWTNYEFN